MQIRIVPYFFSFYCIKTVNTITSCSEIHTPPIDTRTRLNMTCRLESPNFPPCIRIKTTQTGIYIVVQSLSNVDPTTHNCWRREDLLL